MGRDGVHGEGGLRLCLRALGAGTFLCLSLGLFLLYEQPFAPRSSGPLVTAGMQAAR